MSAKEKAVKLAKDIAKGRADYICEKCGRSKEQGWVMHGAHIMPVTWAKTAADPNNILCLCASCHSVGSSSQHQDPVPFSRWLDHEFPGRYDDLRAQAVAYSKNPKPKMDWDEVLKVLREEAKELML